MRIKFFSAIVLALAVNACGLLDSSDKDGQIHELQPLAAGNWWEYEIRYPQRDNPPPDTLRESIREAITVAIDGRRYTAWSWGVDWNWGEFPEYRWLIRNDIGGLYVMGGVAETDTLFINSMHYKYPTRVGDSWETPQVSFSISNHNFYVSDTLSITLIDDDREVQTPSGTYRCYVYHFDLSAGFDVAGRLDYYMFFSPGTGMIKQEERGQTDQRLITEMVLIDYNIQ